MDLCLKKIILFYAVIFGTHEIFAPSSFDSRTEKRRMKLQRELLQRGEETEKRTRENRKEHLKGAQEFIARVVNDSSVGKTATAQTLVREVKDTSSLPVLVANFEELQNPTKGSARKITKDLTNGVYPAN